MLAYFPGGIIADHFSGRRLMTLSLVLTALGGLWFARLPDPGGLMILFGYWGITTILLFWAAMIKVTREIGGENLQGRAFGVLDGGRGLVAAGVASLAVLILGQALPEDISVLSQPERQAAVQQVIYFYSAATLLAAAFIWFAIPESSGTSSTTERSSLDNIKSLLAKPGFWWISLIVVCAYCGYKGVDNYGLYATQVLGMDELESAKFTSAIAYTRPVIAVLAGVLADKILASRTILIGFALMLVTYAILGLLGPADVSSTVLVLNLIVSVCGVFAIRAVYFALLQEEKLPIGVTGTAAGLISVIGFTPDIFFAPVAGRILDAAPGVAGQQNYFILLAVISSLGLVSAALLFRNTLSIKK